VEVVLLVLMHLHQILVVVVEEELMALLGVDKVLLELL
jgi:hypothetical protein